MSHDTTNALQRDILPIPDVTPVNLTTYDAKDPDTDYPPITPLRPPPGAPNVLVVLLDDVGFGAASAFGGPIATPTCDRLAADGLKYTRFHTTAICSPTRAALLTGRNHHTVGMGAITEIATSAPGQNSIRPNTCAPLAEVLKLNGYSTSQFGKCHEVPVWETSPMGPFRQWPTGGRLRVLLRLHRWRDESILSGDLRGDDAGRAVEVAGRGLSLHGGHDREGDQVGAAAEVADGRQALLHVLRARCDARPASRAPRVGRQVQGKVRQRLGEGARGDLRAAESSRRDPERLHSHAVEWRDPRVGRGVSRDEADPRTPDGDLRRLPGAHRSPHRSPHRHAGGLGHPEGHARLRHHRRQRRVGRRVAQWRLQRDGDPHWVRRARNARVPPREPRQVRRARGVQPLCRRVGARDERAISVDEAGGVALGRHA